MVAVRVNKNYAYSKLTKFLRRSYVVKALKQAENDSSAWLYKRCLPVVKLLSYVGVINEHAYS